MQVRNITRTLLCLVMLTMPFSSFAQRPTRDKEKEKQWKSMENGPWNFAPDWYYYFLHNKYSGAEMYWKWAGFNSGFRVRFKEKDSNVKRIKALIFEGDGWLLCYKRLTGDCSYQWPRDESEAGKLTKQQFRWLMEQLKEYPRNDVPEEELKKLMPWSETPPDCCKQLKKQS